MWKNRSVVFEKIHFSKYIWHFSRIFQIATIEKRKGVNDGLFSTVLSATLRGLCVEMVQVEADTSNGLPMFHMVGYLSSEVKEAGERVRTAIKNSGFMLPAKKMVINLSPANIRKRGTMFDLPIAIAILVSLDEIQKEKLSDTLIVGELGLDGSVKEVPGVLPIVLEAKKYGCKVCIVPKENQKEAALADGIRVIGAENLLDVCKYLNGTLLQEEIAEIEIKAEKEKHQNLDYADIKGQKLVKRIAEIAVAGNHNLLMVGPPGVGKSMIARCIPTILPPLTLEESMELTMIYSIIDGLDHSAPLVTERPFREVHHSVSKSALIGGGRIPRPGEISLAHKGVLFLDEIAEFQRPVLDMLRQPMETHKIRILREMGEYEFPAEFLLVAATNPCPCGNYPDLNKCICTPAQIQGYLGKISQPLLDRIDLCVEVERVRYDELYFTEKEESSKEIQNRVIMARQIQKERYKESGIATNAQLRPKDIKKFCALQEEGEKLMRQAFEKMELSVRRYHKILTVARTIADLEGKEQIQLEHLREALSYRTLEIKNMGVGKF